MRSKHELGDALIAKGIKLRQLALLVAVQDSGQMSRAANALNVTQPAASRMLGDLERIMAAELTQRHPRGVTLTAAGERLADRARILLRDLDLAGREVRDIDLGRIGSVHVGSAAGPSLDLVLPIMQRLKQHEPQLRMEITVDSSDRLAHELLSGRLDFYLGRIPDGADPTAFMIQPIGAEPVSLVVRADHELARNPPASIARLLDYDWVMQPTGGLLRRAVEEHLLSHGLPMPARVISTGSLMLSLGFVLKSGAIGVMSTSVAQFYADEGGLGTGLICLPIGAQLSVPAYGLVTLREKVATPAAATFLRVLNERLAAPAP